ncbi:MAG: chemotaxis protein CheW [Acidobacteriota bacterium]
MEVQAGKFLTLTLGNESYGIPILKVREIIGMMGITHVPKMPEFVKGVINLRGKIIPVIDLRRKFGLTDREYDDRTCIIVVEIANESGSQQNGLAVDAVSEVINIDKESIELPPSFGNQQEPGFLTGMGKVKDKVIMLLDIDRILDSDELTLIEGIGGEVHAE